MNEANVCSSGWGGYRGNQFVLKNENKNNVLLNDAGDPKCPWPFEEGPPLEISMKVGSTPGTINVTLKNEKGEHCYRTSGCPGDKQFDTNPKTVIIT